MAQLTSVSILHGPASVCSTVVQDLRAAPLSALQTQQFTPAQGFCLKLADLMISWIPCVCAASVPRQRADWWEWFVLHYCVAAVRPTCVA